MTPSQWGLVIGVFGGWIVMMFLIYQTDPQARKFLVTTKGFQTSLMAILLVQLFAAATRYQLPWLIYFFAPGPALIAWHYTYVWRAK